MYVRAATPRDATAIAGVSRRSTRTAYEDAVDDDAILAATEGESFVDDLREWLTETGSDDRVVYLVAVEEGHGTDAGRPAGGDAGPPERTSHAADGVIGFAQFLVGERAPDRLADGVAYLKSLYVDPDHWNAGAGTALLEAGIDRLPTDVALLKLDVLAANDHGKGFYERRGFERVGEGTFETGDTTYDTDVYALSLD